MVFSNPLFIDPEFNSLPVIQQAIYIDPSIDWRPLPSSPDSKGGLAVLASCNGRYFDQFGDGFLASVKDHLRGATVHIHLLNPTEASLARLSREEADVSYTVAETPDEPTYFACARFLVAAEIMLQRQTDLLITDIDVRFTSATDSLAEAMEHYDGGLFERPFTSPMEICHCSLSYFRCNGPSAIFLAMLRDYIQEMLTRNRHQMWMLDQSALFVVSRRLMQELPGGGKFRWVDLGVATGWPLVHYQVGQEAGSHAKYDLRQHRFAFDLMIRADGAIVTA